MEELRNYLLSTSCVVDNIYLTRYVELIQCNRTTESVKFQTQTHHIVPVIYYVKHNITIDNSPKNKVELLYRDHIIAHYYLALAASDTFKDSFATAFLFLVKRLSLIKDSSQVYSYINDNINKDELFEALPEYQSLYERECQYQHNLNKGGKWMNNGAKQQYVRPSDILEFLNNGYVIGKLPVSDTTRQKMRNRKPWAAGKITVTNGRSNKFIEPEELPQYEAQGWKRGNFGTEKNRGKKMPSDAIERMRQKRIGQSPWNKGKTKETDPRILNYSLSAGGKMSQFKSGNSPWNKGKPWDEATKQKMRHPKTKKSK